MKRCTYSLLILPMVAAPAFAAVTVSSPSNGETLASPFTLSASATACSSQPIASMAYSFDSGADANTVYDASLDVQAAASTGAHTLHVKSWGDQGAVCVTDVDVTVTTESGGGSLAPADAVSVSNIQSLSSWMAASDRSTGGGSAGKMSMVGAPSHSGATREFVTGYWGSGDERYSASFGDDTTSTNFLYDGWVYLPNPSAGIGNLEMDLNQVMPNGQTVIFGFQCDGYSSTWDYTENGGSPQRPVDTWIHSKAACNVRNWSASTWHHVQISYSRTDSGTVTYQAVYLDGVKSTINATVPSAFALGWAPTLLTNFQVDGLGSSGASTVYLDDLVIYRW